MFSLKTSMLKNIDVFQTSPNTKKKIEKKILKTDHSKIEWSKIDDRNSFIKKIDCFQTDQAKMIDDRFLIGITTTQSELHGGRVVGWLVMLKESIVIDKGKMGGGWLVGKAN